MGIIKKIRTPDGEVHDIYDEGAARASALNNYYTKTQIDSKELITVADIDAICGGSIQSASEVTF